jgi:hypothetical protein
LTNLLSLQLEHAGGGRSPLEFGVRRIVAAGFTGRDRAAALAHVRELESHGVTVPARLPTLYPIPRGMLRTDAEIDVLGETSSGEVEAVLLFGGGRVYVGVGSDHTDREVEKISIDVSKVVCPKLIGSSVWSLDEVESRWDGLMLRSWVDTGGGRELYQEGSLRELMAPADLIRNVRDRLGEPAFDGLVLFMGTLPTLRGRMVFGSGFAGELIDPERARSLELEYAIHSLDRLNG